MLNFRYETFLALCEIKNYTKTAEKLHITQPAVTQHIKYLEDRYDCKLFEYKNRKLNLTSEGKYLFEYIKTIQADSIHIKEKLSHNTEKEIKIRFGATLSIGEYIMPSILSTLLEDNPNYKIHMTVANTQVLLEKLNRGDLDFLLVEGMFDKGQYHSVLISEEKFVPLCAYESILAKEVVPFEKLMQNRLIIREKGSGTREIFETILQEYNYSLGGFNHIIEIGNMSAIKELVSRDLGITFLFQVAAEREIREGKLSVIDISGFNAIREFNFVCMKDSFFKEEYMRYFHIMKGINEKLK